MYRLGLMIHSTDSDYSRGIIEGVSAYCTKHNLELIIFSGRTFGWPYGWEYQCTGIYGHIHPGTIDALVIASGTQCNFIGEEAFAAWVRKLEPLPVVSIAIPIDEVPSIVVDNQTGLRKLLEHLYEVHDCRKFAILSGPEENSEARERMAVAKDFFSQRNLREDEQRIFKGDFSAESCYLSLAPWIEKNPLDFEALVCMNDTMASAALAIMKEAGYQVPHDVIVTGFDDIIRSRFEIPTLTTVTQDLEILGNVASSMAHALIRGENLNIITTFHTRALYRQSCGCIGHEEIKNRKMAYGEDLESIDFDAGAVLTSSAAWIRVQDDLVHLREYLANMTSLVSLGDLLDRMHWGLQLFGIESCALVLFDNPIEFKKGHMFKIPSKAELVLHFDKDGSKAGPGRTIRFNPRSRLLPADIFISRARTLIAASLYHRDVQLGYLVWETGDCDPSIYETICVQLSSTIRSALLFEAKQEAETRLNLALKDLERYNTTLSTISRTDELTGLFNRRGFVTLGQESMDLAVRMEKRGLVVFSDMDGLKLINDTWGHEAGDRAIVAMAQALRRTFRSMDIVARLGGDEFAVVALDINKSFVDTLRARLDSILDEFNRTSGEPYTLSLSMGAVEFSGTQNQELEGLLSLADSLLYEEKKCKRARRASQ